METTEQKLLVKKLDESKSLLLSSINRGEVIELIKEIIRIVSPVSPASDERMNNATTRKWQNPMHWIFLVWI
jgi:hypothetical protein